MSDIIPICFLNTTISPPCHSSISFISVLRLIALLSKYTFKFLTLNEHIKSNRNLYDIDVIDKNIDFRRVQNLKVYLDNNAIVLTNDINKIKEWQGGDIVVFKNHIGIVSDKRNKKGIPFIIHHANPYQRYYEEDILEYRNDIIGHYRIS